MFILLVHIDSALRNKWTIKGLLFPVLSYKDNSLSFLHFTEMMLPNNALDNHGPYYASFLMLSTSWTPYKT